MGSGFSKMKKQARMMQEQMEKMRQEMLSKEFQGISGNGLVTVTLDGEKNVKSIKIKPDCVDPEDVEGLEDLISVAFQEASKQVDAESSMMDGGGLPFGL